jgi:hypothetical protein
MTQNMFRYSQIGSRQNITNGSHETEEMNKGPSTPSTNSVLLSYTYILNKEPLTLSTIPYYLSNS